MQIISVVEDEKSISEMIRLNLELDGFQVEVFDDGKKAMDNLSILTQSDLIILDVMLPFHSGLDICQEIRKVAKTPILFLSAKGTTPDKIAGLKLGANDYLAKPFDLEELLLRIHILTQKETQEDTFQIGSKTIHFSTFEVIENEDTQKQPFYTNGNNMYYPILRSMFIPMSTSQIFDLEIMNMQGKILKH